MVPSVVNYPVDPTFKGAVCPYRFFVLRALRTTNGQAQVRHRSAGDGAGAHTPAQPHDHLARGGPRRLGQTKPTPPLLSGALLGLYSPGAAGHGCADRGGPVSG